MQTYNSLPIVLVVLHYSNAILNNNIIHNFFEYKFCTIGCIFSCASKRDQIDTAKFLFQNDIRVSIYHVSNQHLLLEKVLAKYQNHLAVVIDGDCDGVEKLLQECAMLQYFHDTYHWLVLGSKTDVVNKFEDVPLFINADITVAIKNKIAYWNILDVYNPAYKNGGKLIVEDVGIYSEEEGYQIHISSGKYSRRKNMTGVLFKSVMVIPDNINLNLEQYLKNDKDRKNNTFSRFQSVVIQNCIDYYNFEVNISVMSSWGYLQPNGDVDGMLKELKEKRIDFGYAPLMFKLYRLKIIDYGYGTWLMKSAFFFRHPRNTASSYELYLRPLDTGVWVATILALILIVMTLRLIVTQEISLLNVTKEKCSGENSWSFLIIYSIGELCQQGFSYIPILGSGRLVIITVLLFFFLIYQFYSASIVSYLLMEPPRTIRTLLDLLKSDLKAGCEDSLYDRDYIATTTDPVAIELYHKKLSGLHNTTHFYSALTGMEKVKHGGFAFHTQTSTAYPIIESQYSEDVICELAEVQMYTMQTLYATLQKHSPLKEMFNYCMFHQMEVGVLQRLRKHWLSHQPQCVDHTPYLKIEVGLSESYWALILLGVGLFTSFILLLAECVWKKKVEKNIPRLLRKLHYKKS